MNATLRRDGRLDREAVMRAPGLELTVVGEESSDLAAAASTTAASRWIASSDPDLDGVQLRRPVKDRRSM